MSITPTNSSSSCETCEFRSGCFDALSLKELLSMSEAKLIINYKKGETIRKQGSFIKGVLYLKHGVTKAYREIEQIDQNSIVAFNTPGEMIGLTSLFTDKIAQYTVVAITDCTVCCIEMNSIKELLHHNGDFAEKIVYAINNQNRILMDFLISNNYKQLHGRLAGAILFLRTNVFSTDSFNIAFTRKELAEYTNMSTMSVVRILKSFKEDKIIKDKNGYITILDTKKLESVSRNG